ncbi:hypothetical protein MIZ01_0481 [Sideroxyarcus emersonii]|uniref:Uncharacterized protein n=1 Tax=Sideroxyarcus emersonii TaxID=2764705 RepID=A0AAN1X8F5_9PROT|nr:hypothetical protein [Sideroxyarcus emersonii]BCK86715.1 hypothetical protein MIZ01_0481 [Sideroxyarcus emersonii]
MSHLLIAVFLATIALSGVAHAAEPAAAATEQPARADASYVPGMGEIMAATQMRHAKLWFAGQAGNWPLASYELDEIEEGLADAVKYHPVFKQDAPVAAMLDKYTSLPLDELRHAIAAKDASKFRASFHRLTNACNGCHEAAGQGFIVIKRPAATQFGNQRFAPGGR